MIVTVVADVVIRAVSMIAMITTRAMITVSTILVAVKTKITLSLALLILIN